MQKKFCTFLALTLACTLTACAQSPVEGSTTGLSVFQGSRTAFQFPSFAENAGAITVATVSMAVEKDNPNITSADTSMQIRVQSNDGTIIFELNESQTAKDLFAQLPLTVSIEDYGGNEKIFYPPKALHTNNAIPSNGGPRGTLAYYAPWGDVVMFYEDFKSASGLYELGRIVSGEESIMHLSGTITLDKMEPLSSESPQPSATPDESIKTAGYSTESVPVPKAQTTVPPKAVKKQTAAKITVGDCSFSVTLADTQAARELSAYFPMTVEMRELNGQEKYYELPQDLFAPSTEQPETIFSGDILCWSGNTLVLFYKTFSNTYSGYVPLGKVDDPSGLAAALGTGDATVTWELTNVEEN